MTDFFTTKTEAISEYIIPALGDYEDEFDIDGIFDEAFEWEDGYLVPTEEAESDFYAIVRRHEA
jgi:hypothetical protein